MFYLREPALFDLTATASDVTTSISGNGTIDVSAGNGSAVITATSADGTESIDYTINYQVETELTLKHSYTFADGTAKDFVGSADGNIIGGTITEGIYTADELGEYIELPAQEIAINEYASATIELYVTDEVNTTNSSVNTMISYFGGVNEDNGNGLDYYFTSMNCKTSVSCENDASPWSSENSAKTDVDLSDDEMTHHIVSVINSDSITLYVDGYMIGSTDLSDFNKLSYVSPAFAYLMKSGYGGDNTFLGSVLEYNIYSGIMDAQTVAIRSLDIPMEDETTDATLSDLTVEGVTIEGFSPTTFEYTVNSGSIPAVIGTPKVEGADVTVTNATEVPGTTTIVITSKDGSYSNTYTIYFTGSTAVKETEKLDVKVYPTVSNGTFTVKTQGVSSVISVYGLTGKLIKQIKTNASSETFTIDQQGMFIVMVKSDNVIKTFKVIRK